MEYAQMIDDMIIGITTETFPCTDQVVKHVGFNDNNYCYAKFFNADTIRTMSAKITELLQGVDPRNRPIIVPDSTICNVMNAIYQNYRPPTGDIYGRYNVPTGSTVESYVVDMIDQVIQIIVSDVKVNLETEQQNAKLSVWTTVLGDFNDKGLRSYAPIKTRLRRPNPMQFNMNY